jgi:hypothetical protein
MRIEDYPRPEGDTGIGFHWFPDVFHYHKANFDTFAPILSKLGTSWLLLLSEPAKPVPEFFIKGLLERNIEPIIRVYTPTVQAINQQDLRQLCQTYANWGVHYIHVFNEPNLENEWATGEWDPKVLPERFMDYLLPCLETMHSIDGIIPLFTPLSPGGNYLDLDFLKAAFDLINARDKRHLLEKMAVGIHNYAFNRPPTWDRDPLGFRLFQWYDEIIQERVGRSLPQVACENGVRPGEQLTDEYPPIDEERHAQHSVEMCQLLMENQVPGYVFNNAFWLLATDDHQAFREHRWFRDTGQPVLPRSVAALEEMPKHPRPLGPYVIIPSTIRVLMPDGRVEVMDLDEYLKGVVPPEIGVNRPLEALKAQAIAARSYALAGPRHPGEDADVCTTTHCQVWRPNHYAKTDQAVEETTRLVVIYPKPSGIGVAETPDIIRAYYFGHCDGRTRNSEDVWMQALPYCRSVDCVRPFPDLFGHGVGMCQEGAIAMAEQGATHEQILTHYYTDTAVIKASIEPPSPPPPPPPPPPPAWEMTVERKPGLRLLAGTFPRAGIPLTISNPWGRTVSLVSGSKIEHGQGGFETPIWANGIYTIRFLDQTFQVMVQDDFVFVTFTEREGPVTARLLTEWTSPDEAESLLASLESIERYRGLFTIEEEALSSGAVAGWEMSVERKPGLRLLAGTFPRAGIPLTISNPWGRTVSLVSGSKIEHGEGGFETPIWANGIYTIRFLDQTFQVEIQDDFVFVTFTELTGEAKARLVTTWLPEAEAQELWQDLEGDERYQGLFKMERES